MAGVRSRAVLYDAATSPRIDIEGIVLVSHQVRQVVAAMAVSSLLVLGAVAPVTAVTPKHYKNCTALNKVYPHGVGRRHAHDHVSGSTQPVTNFKRSNTLYELNKGSDRDGDKIACEKL